MLADAPPAAGYNNGPGCSFATVARWLGITAGVLSFVWGIVFLVLLFNSGYYDNRNGYYYWPWLVAASCYMIVLGFFLAAMEIPLNCCQQCCFCMASPIARGITYIILSFIGFVGSWGWIASVCLIFSGIFYLVHGCMNGRGMGYGGNPIGGGGVYGGSSVPAFGGPSYAGPAPVYNNGPVYGGGPAYGLRGGNPSAAVGSPPTAYAQPRSPVVASMSPRGPLPAAPLLFDRPHQMSTRFPSVNNNVDVTMQSAPHTQPVTEQPVSQSSPQPFTEPPQPQQQSFTQPPQHEPLTQQPITELPTDVTAVRSPRAVARSPLANAYQPGAPTSSFSHITDAGMGQPPAQVEAV